MKVALNRRGFINEIFVQFKHKYLDLKNRFIPELYSKNGFYE
jgi:hypothetical protein